MKRVRRRAWIILACIVVFMLPIFWLLLPPLWESFIYVSYSPPGTELEESIFVVKVKRWDAVPGADVIRITYDPRSDIHERSYHRVAEYGVPDLKRLHDLLSVTVAGAGPLGPFPARTGAAGARPKR